MAACTNVALGRTNRATDESIFTTSAVSWRGGRHRGSQRHRLMQMETLEGRRLLAVIAGDANRDLYLDESDFVQVLKAGKFAQSDANTVWGDGDWNGDGIFSYTDFRLLGRNLREHGTAAYDPSAGDREHARKALVSGPTTVTLVYDTSSNQLAVTTDVPMSSFHVYSESGAFADTPEPWGRQGGLSFPTTAHSRFVARRLFSPLAIDFAFLGATTSTMTVEQLLSDLTVDGSYATQLGGGDIGDVQLDLCDGCVTRNERPIPERQPAVWTTDGTADVMLTYDRVTGGIQVDSESSLVSFTMTSNASIFKKFRSLGLSDCCFSGHAREIQYSSINEFSEINLGNIAESGLAEEFLLSEAFVNVVVVTPNADGSDGKGMARSVQLVVCNLCNDKFNREWNPSNSVHLEFDFPNLPSLSETNASLVYDSVTGEMLYSSPFTTNTVEIQSESANFVENAPPGFLGPFDQANDDNMFYLYPQGFSQLYLGHVTTPGQSVDQLAADLKIDGSRSPEGSSITPVEIVMCDQCLLGKTDEPNELGDVPVADPGDANRDGRFTSADLVQVVQSGKYEDDIANNASWDEGDWNGDGEFDSSDLVAAFRTGSFSYSVRPLAVEFVPMTAGDESEQVHTASNGIDLTPTRGQKNDLSAAKREPYRLEASLHQSDLSPRADLDFDQRTRFDRFFAQLMDAEFVMDFAAAAASSLR